MSLVKVVERIEFSMLVTIAEKRGVTPYTPLPTPMSIFRYGYHFKALDELFLFYFIQCCRISTRFQVILNNKFVGLDKGILL